jgi:hypothetical protein
VGGDRPVADFPPALRIGATLFAAVFVTVHWSHDNQVNFLWLSDVGMFGAVAALWLRSRLLASMMLLATALPDGVGWGLDFLCGLVAGWHPLNATNYMFDPKVPLVVRGLSLFHLAVPVLLVWVVHRIGYDRRALGAQTALTVALFWACWAFVDPARNINWVFGPGRPQSFLPGWAYLLALMAAFPVMCYLPAHLIMILLGWDRRGARAPRNTRSRGPAAGPASPGGEPRAT